MKSTWTRMNASWGQNDPTTQPCRRSIRTRMIPSHFDQAHKNIFINIADLITSVSDKYGAEKKKNKNKKKVRWAPPLPVHTRLEQSEKFDVAKGSLGVIRMNGHDKQFRSILPASLAPFPRQWGAWGLLGRAGYSYTPLFDAAWHQGAFCRPRPTRHFEKLLWVSAALCFFFSLLEKRECATKKEKKN